MTLCSLWAWCHCWKDYKNDKFINETRVFKESRVYMKRTITIEGMTCGHCQARVEKALNAIDGVKAKVDLKNNSAAVEADGSVTDEMLIKTVEEAGYKVTSVQEKKGFFGK